MNIRIVCAGKLKERFYKEACDEYVKRLSRYCTMEICEVNDEKAPESLSKAQEQQVMDREGQRLLGKIREGDHVIALCVEGKALDSVAFARRLSALADSGKGTVDFIIGGSLGLSAQVLSRADEGLSLSSMTLPHRLCRVFLLEQIYRGFKINSNEPYHK